jgi:hypothetical protein
MGNERSITTLQLFKSQTILGGTCGTAGPFDLRDCMRQGKIGITYAIEPIGVSSCGTCSFVYQACHAWEGESYVSIGTAGTIIGTAGQSGILDISLPTVPFIKVLATMGTSADHVLTGKFTAHLHVR